MPLHGSMHLYLFFSLIPRGILCDALVVSLGISPRGIFNNNNSQRVWLEEYFKLPK